MPTAHPNFPHNEEDHATIPLPDASLADLTPSEALFAYQSGNPSQTPPLPIESLTPSSLLAGRITSNPRLAVAAYNALLRIGVLDQETRTPVTDKITDKLVPEIEVLSVPQTKELVNLLFYWDERVKALRAQQ